MVARRHTLIILVLLVLSSFTPYASPAAATSPPSTPNLGTASGFGVLARSAVTNAGNSVVGGDLGVSPGTAVTGFPPGRVAGVVHKNDAVAAQAEIDLASAYNAISGDSCTSNLTGQNLGGLTLTPGVYCFSSAASLTGTLTLNFQGNNNAAFIFKIVSALTTASSSSVVMTAGGGDSFCNVFWQVGSSAVLGTNTGFNGNILALASITLGTGASIAGSALARNGAVTLDTNHVGACPAQPIWTQQMQHTPTPSQGGCFDGTFPNTAWNEVPCHPSGNNSIPASVGNTNDYSGEIVNSGTYIGYAQGSFSNVQGIMSEYDNGEHANDYYSLQLNSPTFSCTPVDGSGSSANGCWEQFMYQNFGGSGEVRIELWLWGYYNQYASCPTSSPNWEQKSDSKYGTDCEMYSDYNATPDESATSQIGSLSITAMTNYEGSGNDQDTMCNGGYCYSVTIGDNWLGLYNDQWSNAEFGVFGLGNLSQAQFNSGTSITVNLQEQDGSGTIITPTCDSIGFTGETNNLNLSGSCSVSGYYEIMGFTESN